MAQVNMSFEHGQAPEVARANFRRGIEKAQSEHGRWIRDVSWSDDGTSAILKGPSYEVTMSLNDTHVHARGHVPLAFKLFERPVRKYIEQTLTNQD